MVLQRLKDDNCISHFLRTLGCGGSIDNIQMLLLAILTQFTHDLRELAVVVVLPGTKSTPAPTDSPSTALALFNEIRDILTTISTIPPDRAHTTALHHTLDVYMCGSVVSATALHGAALDITILQRGDPSMQYYLRSCQNSAQHISQLMCVELGGTDVGILLHYPSCYSIALPLLGARELLGTIGGDLTRRLHQFYVRENHDKKKMDGSTLFLHSGLLKMDVNITVNQKGAVEAAEMIQKFLQQNEFARPVIIFMKVVLKLFEIHPLQITPYVVTLMVVAFVKYSSHMHPLLSAAHYPRPREVVEPGYLLLSFLCFFSPSPRGRFDPQLMRLVPSHPCGILFREGERSESSALLGEDADNDDCHARIVDGNGWIIMDLTQYGGNAAAACTLIHECRYLFESILVRLLQHYGGDELSLPQIRHSRPAAHSNQNDVDSVMLKSKCLPVHNPIISVLLQRS